MSSANPPSSGESPELNSESPDSTQPPIQDLRRDFGRTSLVEAVAGEDPFALFRQWFDEALRSQLRDANAFVLATANTAGRPSSRVLLLKDYSASGFVFYTNYVSRKAVDLAENPYAAMLFYWAEHERQVRIEGQITKVSREESAEYFASRPRASQLGAHASKQSWELTGRAELEDQFAALEKLYGTDAPIPLPEDWGGYLLVPDSMEFWQGRSNRLHDRLLYTNRADTGKADDSVEDAPVWLRSRLSP